jgi:hypothetical protein
MTPAERISAWAVRINDALYRGGDRPGTDAAFLQMLADRLDEVDDAADEIIHRGTHKVARDWQVELRRIARRLDLA